MLCWRIWRAALKTFHQLQRLGPGGTQAKTQKGNKVGKTTGLVVSNTFNLHQSLSLFWGNDPISLNFSDGLKLAGGVTVSWVYFWYIPSRIPIHQPVEWNVTNGLDHGPIKIDNAIPYFCGWFQLDDEPNLYELEMKWVNITPKKLF